MYTPNTNNINPSYYNPYYTSEYSQMNMFNTMHQQPYMYNPMMQQNQQVYNSMMPQHQTINPMMQQSQPNFNPFIQPINPFIHPTQNNNMNKK